MEQAADNIRTLKRLPPLPRKFPPPPFAVWSEEAAITLGKIKRVITREARGRTPDQRAEVAEGLFVLAQGEHQDCQIPPEPDTADDY